MGNRALDDSPTYHPVAALRLRDGSLSVATLYNPGTPRGLGVRLTANGRMTAIDTSLVLFATNGTRGKP